MGMADAEDDAASTLADVSAGRVGKATDSLEHAAGLDTADTEEADVATREDDPEAARLGRPAEGVTEELATKETLSNASDDVLETDCNGTARAIVLSLDDAAGLGATDAEDDAASTLPDASAFATGSARGGVIFTPTPVTRRSDADA